MENKIGVIESKTISEGIGKNGKPFKRCVFVIGGFSYSSFDKKLMEDFKMGDAVSYDIEEENGYINLKGMKKIDNPNATPPVEVVAMNEKKIIEEVIKKLPPMPEAQLNKDVMIALLACGKIISNRYERLNTKISTELLGQEAIKLYEIFRNYGN